MTENELRHHGILGQKWGVRRFQNPDGTLTAAGKKRYAQSLSEMMDRDRKATNKAALRLKVHEPNMIDSEAISTDPHMQKIYDSLKKSDSLLDKELKDADRKTIKWLRDQAKKETDPSEKEWYATEAAELEMGRGGRDWPAHEEAYYNDVERKSKIVKDYMDKLLGEYADTPVGKRSNIKREGLQFIYKYFDENLDDRKQ